MSRIKMNAKQIKQTAEKFAKKFVEESYSEETKNKVSDMVVTLYCLKGRDVL